MSGPGINPCTIIAPKQDSLRRATGYAERQHRHEAAALSCVIRRFRRDHAPHVALGKRLFRALGRLQRVTVRDPVRHCAGDTWHRAENRADTAAT
jgi:hypothetical protein